MSTRKHLNAFQRDEILKYRQQGMSYRKIAGNLDVNRNQVARFLQKKSFTKTTETRGGKINFTKREKRALKTLTTKNLLSAKEIKRIARHAGIHQYNSASLEEGFTVEIW